MGTTTSGYPYPEDSDPVAQGAQAIKALAQKTEELQRASSRGGSDVHLTDDAVGSLAVTFPVGRFPGPPQVAACTDSTSYFASVTSITADGMTVHVRHFQNTPATTTITVHWIAST